MEKVYLKVISSKIEAYKRCLLAGNKEWETNHRQAIEEQLEELPHGSGIDSGVQFDWDNSTSEKLIFTTSFHHMNGNGFYDGWTEHKIIVTPSFSGYNMKITGRDRNMIKDYLHDVFASTFSMDEEPILSTEKQ